MTFQQTRPITKCIGLAIAAITISCLTIGCQIDRHPHCDSCYAGSTQQSKSVLQKPIVERVVDNAPNSKASKIDDHANSVESDPEQGVSNSVVQRNVVKQVSYVDESVAGIEIPAEPFSQNTAERFPVDLATVLQLAGADNWNVRIARQQIREAAANVDLAKAAILPSLNLGLVYNVHEGEIQGTDGNIIDVTRSSLFLGGGAVVANSPLNGGSGGPARLFVDFSLADAWFKPLAARRRLDAARANRCRVLNDTLLEATLAYYELVRSQSLLAVADKNLQEAVQVARLTEDFIEGGKGSEADIHRINVAVNNRRQTVVQARAAMEVASARLAEVLQIDPCEADPQIGLFAIEMQPHSIEIIDWSIDLNSYIDLAQSTRCEITQEHSELLARGADHEAEVWRSVLPNLYLGYSGGVFGGGPAGGFGGLDFRHDVDIGLAWQIKNLGFGNTALKNVTRSQQQQQLFRMRQVRDKISQQVSTTFHSTRRYQQEICLYRDNISQSQQALAKNLDAIRGLEGLPLEAFQSLDATAKSRLDYLNSVVNYNQWQLRLLRATGQPFAEAGCGSGNCSCCNSCEKCTSMAGGGCCDCPKNSSDCRHR